MRMRDGHILIFLRKPLSTGPIYSPNLIPVSLNCRGYM